MAVQALKVLNFDSQVFPVHLDSDLRFVVCFGRRRRLIAFLFVCITIFGLFRLFFGLFFGAFFVRITVCRFFYRFAFTLGVLEVFVNEFVNGVVFCFLVHLDGGSLFYIVVLFVL